MASGLGPLKRINVLGKAIIGFGGREGVDSKVMLFLPGSGVHYTHEDAHVFRQSCYKHPH